MTSHLVDLHDFSPSITSTLLEESDKSLLCDILPELHHLNSTFDKTDGEDIVTVALAEWLKDRKVPLHLPFLLDVYLTLQRRFSCEAAFSEMDSCVKTMMNSMSNFLQQDLPRNKAGTDPNDKIQKVMEERKLRTLVDTFYQKKQTIYTREVLRINTAAAYHQRSMLKLDTAEEFYLLRRNPLLCGMQLMTQMIHYQWSGLTAI